MPKMKTHTGAKKRFKLTASGKVRFKRAKMRHMQSNKDKSMKRKARHSGILCDSDAGHVAKLLPYS
jgi:large subunit ribosomal protein L35